MNNVVDISIGVIERMNLSDHEVNDLIDRLKSTIQKQPGIEIEEMTDEEKYDAWLRKEIINRGILFPPNK